MICNLFEKNIVKVLVVFLISPGSRYKRKEIKEMSGMNNVPFDLALIKLVNLGIISKKKNLYFLSFDNDFKDVIEELRKEFVEFNLPLEVYYVLIDISDKLFYFKDVSVYLFGSYAKLIYHEKSDIDIAVFGGDERKIKKAIGKIGKKVEFHFFGRWDVSGEDALIKDIMRNGRRIV